MEPLFKSTNTITEKRAREHYRNVSLRYHIFYLILLLISIYYNIYWAYYTYEINLIYIGLLIFVIIGYIIKPYTYAKARILEYKNLFNSFEIWETFFMKIILLTKVYSQKKNSELNMNV